MRPGHYIHEHYTRWQRGYFNADPMHGPEHYRREQDKLDRQREADLLLSVTQDGLPDAPGAIQWAHERARDWEQGAKEGRNPHPVAYGYELTLCFLVRLASGLELRAALARPEGGAE